jgi:hypothetical protein
VAWLQADDAIGIWLWHVVDNVACHDFGR